MASDIDICNLGLLRIGQSTRIASLDEESEPASTCQFLLPLMRDAVLRDFTWTFASRRVVAELIEAAPSTDWAFAYRVPSDYINVIRIVDPMGRNPNNRVPFEIEGDDSGRVLYCNVDAPSLHYIARVTIADLYPPDFVDALGWRMASELAEPIARDAGRRERALKSYTEKIEAAKANSANEQLSLTPDQSGLETARA